MIYSLLLALLTIQMEPVHCQLGEPLTVFYDAPDETVLQSLPQSLEWSVLQQSGIQVTLVPLALDTVNLPQLSPVGDSQPLFAPPLLIVSRTMPDSSWNVTVFPAPLVDNIPPGYPANYLNRLCFWEKWSRSPVGRWILPTVIAAVVAMIILAFLLIRRRRRQSTVSPGAGESFKARSPLDEVRALLDSKAFASGNWIEYYRQMDRLLRETVAIRFGIVNDALTWHQMKRLISKDAEGRKFMEDSGGLIGEIILQRYASWGGSRDRARKFTGVLATIRKEWHRV